MAFTVSAVWEVEASANDANGGGFDPGVAGFPTDGTVDSNTGNTASPVFSSASYSFVAGDVGAWIYIKSGINSLPGWYKIVSVAGGKATLSAAIGAGVLAAGVPTTALGLATVGTPTSLTWGVDYSQQTSPQITFTDMVIGGTTTQFTSAANPVGKNFVGNIINVTSGTGFTVQRVAVVSTSGTTATCDKSLGTGASTGGNGKLGGAFASPALPFSVVVAGNSVWVKTGAYSITSSSANVAGGVINSTLASMLLMGYASVRGDFGTPPVLTASGISSATILTTSTTTDSFVANITIDCASLTSIQGVAMGRGIGYLIQVRNATNNGFTNNATVPLYLKCSATGCSSQPAFANSNCQFCEAYSNTVTGFSGCNPRFCLSYSNSGASSDGFIGSSGVIFHNCIAYGNGRDGFRGVGVNSILTTNCIAESNSGVGINLTGVADTITNCGVYSNGTNSVNSGLHGVTLNLVTGTSSFFVNAASANFALNANAGGGALLRAAGIPGITPDGLSAGYLDIGAIQSPPLWPPARAFTGSN